MCYTIKNWPAAERPRERVRTLGAQALTTRELLTLLIETGRQEREGVPARTAFEMAGDLLAAFAGDGDGEDTLRRIMNTPVAGIAGRVPGIGPAKATRILAALELGRRAAAEARPERARVQTARDVYERMRFRMRDLEQEEFHLLLLNTQQEILREVFLTRGTLDCSVIHPRDVFKHAMRESAASIVLVHNHPSGEPTPSLDDRQVTYQLVAAGDMMGIPIADHIIIGEARYHSFKETGELRTGLSGGRRRLAAA